MLRQFHSLVESVKEVTGTYKVTIEIKTTIELIIVEIHFFTSRQYVYRYVELLSRVYSMTEEEEETKLSEVLNNLQKYIEENKCL